MDWDLSHAFLLLFFIGLCFALVSLVLYLIGGGFDGHAHVDVGGASGDVISHGDIVSGDQTSGASLHFSPFSPQVLSTFATFFGGAGYASLKLFELSPIASLGIGFGSGLVFSALLYLAITKIFIKTQASSEPRTTELIGTSADVTVGIPKGGTGEVGYTTMGSRYTAPAVSTNGEEIPAHSLVRIQRISAGLFHVEPLQKNAAKS